MACSCNGDHVAGAGRRAERAAARCRSANRKDRCRRIRETPAGAADQAGELRHAQHAVRSGFADAGHRRGAQLDPRGDAPLEREAAGQLRHPHHSAAGPHHAPGRSAQRDGDPAGPFAAAHLRQRPLRLAEYRRPEPVECRGARCERCCRGRSPDACRLRSQRRGQRRQRRRQRHGVDDGAGAGVCGERHRVRRDAGVHLLGG